MGYSKFGCSKLDLALSLGQLHKELCDIATASTFGATVFQDGPLDFYLMSGDEAELRRRPRMMPKDLGLGEGPKS